MKRLAFMILHTGAPYLRYAVASILPQVDKLMIFYSAKPSQGYQTEMECPDTRKELLREFEKGVGENQSASTVWVDGEWQNETDHVNAVNEYAEGYDWLVRVDADEIFPPGMVDEMIRQAETKEKRDAREYRIPFVHFWRSFSRCCRDGSHPIRLTRLNGGQGIRILDAEGSNSVVLPGSTLPITMNKWEVLHFGYAQPTKYIIYKMAVSGHKAEWRNNWLVERWLPNAQKDVHPVMFPTHWMTEPYYVPNLPAVLYSHLYWNLQVIE